MTGDRDSELLVSHDELMVVCKAQMEIILRAGLHIRLEKALKKDGVEPGFSSRAEEVQEKFKLERLKLMASGAIR